MLGCHACQDQMLEYLYDLLDGAERRELEGHLASCPACQAALVLSRGQQKLLAAAAREDAVADARQGISAAEEDRVLAEKERDEQIKQVHDAVKARELRLVVSGPRAVQSGAPAEYQVRTYDLNGQPVPARLVPRLVAT